MTPGRPSTGQTWKMFQPGIFLSVMLPLPTLPFHRLGLITFFLQFS